jgi:hypothetical protein
VRHGLQAVCVLVICLVANYSFSLSGRILQMTFFYRVALHTVCLVCVTDVNECAYTFQCSYAKLVCTMTTNLICVLQTSTNARQTHAAKMPIVTTILEATLVHVGLDFMETLTIIVTVKHRKVCSHSLNVEI